ncbi:MAG: methionyl-tRNA formyltransferase [Clostridiales bacterium]
MVVAYGQILRQAVLGLAPLGVINVHASLLPAYRGAAPIHWAIINGEKQTGVTTMFIEQGLDCGDMILKATTVIDPEEDTGSLHDRLAELGGKLLVDTLALFAQGSVYGCKQDPALATYAPMLKKEDELICWSDSAQKLHDQIRGLHPFPGSYTWYKGKRLKIKAARLLNAAATVVPGCITGVDKERITVAAGDGQLALLVVQPEGKGAMSAADFGRGYGVKSGEMLG